MVFPDSPDQFADKSYDYLIIGGGTAGLVLAARLTEDPNITVGVLEAGEARLADPSILIYSPSTAFDPEYNWGFSTIPQENINSRPIIQPIGRILGGCSAINGMVCTYASTTDIDNWGALGNPGWFFEDLLPYYKKSTIYTPPSKEIAEFYNADVVIDKKLHKTHGDGVKTGFPRNKMIAAKEWLQTFENLGLSMNVDMKTGGGLGGFSNLLTVDTASSTRSYSATAYYAPNAGRPNLTILTSAVANKITFSQPTDDHEAVPIANGVDFTAQGTNYHVSCKYEVLLCAGAFQSPKILELSGIGSPAILSKYNIPVLVDLPSVGENLQDHTEVPMSYELATHEPTIDDLTIPGVVASEMTKFYATQTDILATLLASGADLSYQQITSTHGSNGKESMEQFILKAQQALEACKTEGLKAQYNLQIASILSAKDTTAQLLTIPVGIDPRVTAGERGTPVPGNFLTILSNHAHPFSRGSVHISSSDPTAMPAIDPRYMEQEIDMQVLSDIVLFTQYLATQEPLASKLKNGGHAFRPGFYQLDRDNVEEYIRSALESSYHPLGSCSMMPKELGGVVDTCLRVYGTKGLRIVDASVFPMAIRNNCQTSVYAVAEKAADIIKEDWRHRYAYEEKMEKRGRGPEVELEAERKDTTVEGKQGGKRTKKE